MGRAVDCLKALIPGQACSICYAIFSVWGAVLLFVAGISLNAGYRKIDNDAIDDDELDAAALQIYIAAGVYCACVLGCGARWYYVTFYNPAPPKPRRFGQSEDV